MQLRAPRNRLILLGFVLGLFGVFATSPSRAEIASNGAVVVLSEAATAANVVAILVSPDGSGSVLTGAEIDVSDDFGVVLEDSDELLRLETQRQSCVIDYVAVEVRVPSQVVPERHASTSPPLLV